MATERYDGSSQKFKEAKDEFAKVDDGSADDRMADCDSRVSMIDRHKGALQDELDERLKDALRNAQGKKKLESAKEHLEQTKKFGEVKEEFEDAERLLDDGADKEEAVEKAQLCDELASSLMDTLNKRLQDALDMAGENDEETDQDLLAIYHAFSMQVECMVDGQEVHDAGIPREKGQARNRLDALMAELSKFKAEK